MATPNSRPRSNGGCSRIGCGALLILFLLAVVGRFSNSLTPPDPTPPVATVPTPRPVPATAVPPTFPPVVLTEDARRFALVPTPPPTEPPLPISTPNMETQLRTVAEAAARQERSVNQVQMDILPLSTGRWEVDVYCDLTSDFLAEAGAKQVAFDIHKTLWTSGLPVGVVQAWVYAPGGSPTHIGKLWANSRAGYTLMHTQDWGGSGPSVWANFLQTHTLVDTNNDEDAVWFN